MAAFLASKEEQGKPSFLLAGKILSVASCGKFKR